MSTFNTLHKGKIAEVSDTCFLKESFPVNIKMCMKLHVAS